MTTEQTWKEIRMKIAIITSFVVLMLSGCTEDNNAMRILLDQGYTHIHITGYNMVSCSDDDIFKTGFTATSIAGKPVKGTVCTGLFKGSTIILD